MFTYLGIVASIFLLALAWSRWVRPAREVRDALHRLASGDLRPVLAGRCGNFHHAQLVEIDRIAQQIRTMRQQLNEEGFSLRAILRSMVEGVIITDRNFRIRLANEALMGMFLLRNSVLNRSVMEVFHDSSLQQAMDNALGGEAARRVFAMEIPVEGRFVKKYFEVSAVALRPGDSTRAAGVLAVFHDVTETRALEVIRQDLIVNVSHELRTPLSIIKGYVETLLDGAVQDPELAEKFLRIMHKHGERLDLLIADLLNLSRLESGKARLHLEWIDLRRCVEVVMQRLEVRVQQQRAVIELIFPKELPQVRADVHRLDQVFTNLLENALKFSPQGRALVGVEARQCDGEVRVTVSDNGPGVPLSDQPHVFERFYRVQKDRNRDAGGTGLGLSIVKHIVLLHGGKVWLQSVPGSGAEFGFTLPIGGPEPHAMDEAS